MKYEGVANMFKKIYFFIVCLVGIISADVFAGDIPEHLMSGEQKAVFIGEIISLGESSCEIRPITVMMGEIEEETIVVNPISEYYGTNTSPKIEDFIVAVLINDNEIDDLWIFKTTTDNYETLKLISNRYNMVERYEEYINTGAYFEAQKKLDLKNGTNIVADNKDDKLKVEKAGPEVLEDDDTNTNEETTDYRITMLLRLLGITLGGAVIYMVLKKKKA